MMLISGSGRRGLLAGAAALLAIVPAAVRAEAGPGYAAILVDADSREVLYANGADLPRHPASITKIMTLFLAFDALSSGRLHLDDPVVMTRNAADQKPSRLGIRPGQSLTIDQAIRVIAVKSANDVAVALAEKLGGSEENFAALMTRRARALGMRNTIFVNATGLPDPAHITTARDLAIMSAALIRTYPRYYTYFSTATFSYDKLTFANHNHLLGRMPGMDGIKTGYTVDAGFTLAASAVRGAHRMIAVVLGEPSATARDRDVSTLLDTGFAVEAGRAQGQQLTVAGLLAPIAHPAIRIALPGLDQGSGDGARTVTRAEPRRAPARERDARAPAASERTAPARHGTSPTAHGKRGSRAAARDENATHVTAKSKVKGHRPAGPRAGTSRSPEPPAKVSPKSHKSDRHTTDRKVTHNRD